MEAEKLSKILELHKKWINNEPGGEQANLREADLWRADLGEANLDYSCWPLWCGSLGVRVCNVSRRSWPTTFAGWFAMTRR